MNINYVFIFICFVFSHSKAAGKEVDSLSLPKFSFSENELVEKLDSFIVNMKECLPSTFEGDPIAVCVYSDTIRIGDRAYSTVSFSTLKICDFVADFPGKFGVAVLNENDTVIVQLSETIMSYGRVTTDSVCVRFAFKRIPNLPLDEIVDSVFDSLKPWESLLIGALAKPYKSMRRYTIMEDNRLVLNMDIKCRYEELIELIRQSRIKDSLNYHSSQ